MKLESVENWISKKPKILDSVDNQGNWSWKRLDAQSWKQKINSYSKYKLIKDIRAQLDNERRAEFEASCFGHFLRFDAEAKICCAAVHAVLAREITVPNAKKGEFWFRIGQRSLRFSPIEFCTITGLKFGTSSFDPNTVNDPIDGVYKRHFAGHAVVANDLWHRFAEGEFSATPADALKVAYVLFVELFLFGIDPKLTVRKWLWRIVEDPVVFDSFPWGKFAFQCLHHNLKRAPSDKKMTYHIYGFLMAFQIWAYECIPSLGTCCATRRSEEDVPRCLRWVMPRTSLDVCNILTSDTPCGQIEPTKLEQAQRYMTDIEMDLSVGIQYRHPATPIRNRATKGSSQLSSTSSSHRRSRDESSEPTERPHTRQRSHTQVDVSRTMKHTVQRTLQARLDVAVSAAIDRVVPDAVNRVLTAGVDRPVAEAVDRAVESAFQLNVRDVVDRVLKQMRDDPVDTSDFQYQDDQFQMGPEMNSQTLQGPHASTDTGAGTRAAGIGMEGEVGDHDSVPNADQSGSDRDDFGSDVTERAQFAESNFEFKDVKGFEDFKISVGDIIVDSEIPMNIRRKYYELCCRQKMFLHEHLIEGISSKLAAVMISETVNIVDAIRAANLSTSLHSLKCWDKTLESFEVLGFSVGFLRARLHKLVILSCESGAITEARREKLSQFDEAREAHAASILKIKELMDSLEAEAKALFEVKRGEVEALEVKNEKLGVEFMEIVGAT